MLRSEEEIFGRIARALERIATALEAIRDKQSETSDGHKQSSGNTKGFKHDPWKQGYD